MRACARACVCVCVCVCEHVPPHSYILMKPDTHSTATLASLRPLIRRIHENAAVAPGLGKGHAGGTWMTIHTESEKVRNREEQVGGGRCETERSKWEGAGAKQRRASGRGQVRSSSGARYT